MPATLASTSFLKIACTITPTPLSVLSAFQVQNVVVVVVVVVLVGIGVAAVLLMFSVMVILDHRLSVLMYANNTNRWPK